MDVHTGGTKHLQDNQLQSLELPFKTFLCSDCLVFFFWKSFWRQSFVICFQSLFILQLGMHSVDYLMSGLTMGGLLFLLPSLYMPATNCIDTGVCSCQMAFVPRIHRTRRFNSVLRLSCVLRDMFYTMVWGAFQHLIRYLKTTSRYIWSDPFDRRFDSIATQMTITFQNNRINLNWNLLISRSYYKRSYVVLPANKNGFTIKRYMFLTTFLSEFQKCSPRDKNILCSRCLKIAICYLRM